jgi:hypothetical protein
MCNSKSRWAEERKAMKEAIEQYRADKYEVHRLKEEKIVQDIEMVSLRTAYSRL